MKEELHIFGIRAVLEALEAGKTPEKVLVRKDLTGNLFRQLQEAAKKHNMSLTVVPPERFRRFESRNHQGVVAVLSPITYREHTALIDETLARDKAPLFLLLDGVSDVRNLGAIIRTAECAGVSGLFLPASGSAPVSADTIKTSAGAAFNLPIARSPHLKDVVYYLQASGVRLVAATEKAESTLYEADLTGPLAVIMGSEDRGIHPSLLKLCDIRARLPMRGSIESLNVSVACGVFLFEAQRQRG
ncbi:MULTISPECIES: 23S rRNA (guanosine(2251)-2'-O)-methyltransferase RlmB [unclassified Robiginitalea]|uniref:23S rRNA (guanosine(2251)-2'-O)-methyltransferase RlmB n=1 Tax=Robiginitalea TaxID=252306 RepID=UPI0023492629|nr:MULTISPECIES: 23S rRNA (guanosine(2251)-2'-O)-methyltransferase RlmB [unclassified Robiginitalea]MDC6355516.1 23S rRNA (guanosine(2251)-2'-O)-methyltransferase RlmB [Robiginitalea sp. PM2]MDC6375874.1 23S rRNA (guanosine(2251)-2'-O)-methyltransferase RlmB [Robiginitalea sp. SP8]